MWKSQFDEYFLFISKTLSFDIFLNKVLGKEESLFLLSLSSSRLVRSSKQLLSRISIWLEDRLSTSNLRPFGKPAFGIVVIILFDKSNTRIFSNRERSTFLLNELILLLDRSRYWSTSLGAPLKDEILLFFNTNLFRFG